MGVCVVVMLAAGSIALLGTNATQHGDTQSQPKMINRGEHADMQEDSRSSRSRLTDSKHEMGRGGKLALITKLARDLNVTESQLTNMMMERSGVQTLLDQLDRDLNSSCSQLIEITSESGDMQAQIQNLTQMFEDTQLQIVEDGNVSRGLPGKRSRGSSQLGIGKIEPVSNKN